MAAVAPPPLSVGYVLGRSFRIWTRNIVPFTIVGGAGFLPVFGIVALLREPPPFCKNASDILAPPAIVIAVVLLWLAMPAAVIHGVLQQLRGERPSVLGCARLYVTRLLPVLGVGFVLLLLALCTSVALGLVTGMVVRDDPGDWFSVLVITLAGALVAGPYWVSVAAAAVEKKRVGASLRRSLELTRGFRGRVSLISLATLAFLSVPATVMQYAGLRGWIAAVLAIVLSGYGAVACAVGYHDLRAAADGMTVERLVELFA